MLNFSVKYVGRYFKTIIMQYKRNLGTRIYMMSVVVSYRNYFKWDWTSTNHGGFFLCIEFQEEKDKQGQWGWPRAALTTRQIGQVPRGPKLVGAQKFLVNCFKIAAWHCENKFQDKMSGVAYINKYHVILGQYHSWWVSIWVTKLVKYVLLNYYL